MTPNICPFIRYRDAPNALTWLTRAFGFETLIEHANPDGTIAHAEVGLGAGVVGVSSATPPAAENPWSTVRQGIYVHVPDVDAHYERARTAGAEIALLLRDTAYGSREYSARDVENRLWAFGTFRTRAGEGEPNIFPELRYRSPDAIAWLARAFGFRSTAEVRGENGAVVHAEMQFGDGTIMMDVSGGDPGAWRDLTHAVSVRIDDPDAHCVRAKVAGADIALAPFTTRYGARSYWARDPEGFLWGFSTYRPAIG